jgi:hypothetical protein
VNSQAKGPSMLVVPKNGGSPFFFFLFSSAPKNAAIISVQLSILIMRFRGDKTGLIFQLFQPSGPDLNTYINKEGLIENYYVSIILS